MASVTTLPTVATVATRRDSDLLTNLGEIERVAKACAASGYYKDVRDASQAVVKMLAGREMGVGPIQALAGIYIVEGKPSAGANLIAANVKRSGRYDYRVRKRTDEECVLAWYDAGQEVGESSFTRKDAERAGLWGKQNWSKYPRAMLFARALTEGVRVYCPDAASGVVYVPEELAPDMPVTEDGTPVAQPVEPVREERDVTPPREPGERQNGYATEKQAKRLWAIAATRAGELEAVSREEIVRDVLGRRGIESSKAIPLDAYDRIVQDVETWEPPVGDASAEPAGAESF